MATNDEKAKGVLVDMTRCIGCRGCQAACKSWNEQDVTKTKCDGDYTSPKDLSSSCYTNIRYVEQEKDNIPVWSFVKSQCMHCKDPACVSACPVGAFTKTDEGAVLYNFDRCIGCRYCMVACPFGIPKYEWKSTSPAIRKCTFCSDRLVNGKKPACVQSCPSNAMTFGGLADITKEAEKRLREHPGKYVNHIFGKEEAGGTQWLYISAIPFDQLGFVTKIPPVKLPGLTWNMLSEIPFKVGALVVGLSLIAAFRNRSSDDSASDTKQEKEK
jgi:formate dehydrogenase iron-sulfur subunit